MQPMLKGKAPLLASSKGARSIWKLFLARQRSSFSRRASAVVSSRRL